MIPFVCHTQRRCIDLCGLGCFGGANSFSIFPVVVTGVCFKCNRTETPAARCVVLPAERKENRIGCGKTCTSRARGRAGARARNANYRDALGLVRASCAYYTRRAGKICSAAVSAAVWRGGDLIKCVTSLPSARRAQGRAGQDQMRPRGRFGAGCQWQRD